MKIIGVRLKIKDWTKWSMLISIKCGFSFSFRAQIEINDRISRICKFYFMKFTILLLKYQLFWKYITEILKLNNNFNSYTKIKVSYFIYFVERSCFMNICMISPKTIFPLSKIKELFLLAMIIYRNMKFFAQLISIFLKLSCKFIKNMESDRSTKI